MPLYLNLQTRKVWSLSSCQFLFRATMFFTFQEVLPLLFGYVVVLILTPRGIRQGRPATASTSSNPWVHLHMETCLVRGGTCCREWLFLGSTPTHLWPWPVLKPRSPSQPCTVRAEACVGSRLRWQHAMKLCPGPIVLL